MSHYHGARIRTRIALAILGAATVNGCTPGDGGAVSSSASATNAGVSGAAPTGTPSEAPTRRTPTPTIVTVGANGETPGLPSSTGPAPPAEIVDAGPPDPLVTRFCDAVMRLPEQRRGECCSKPSPTAASFTTQCVQVLSSALRRRALELAPADVDRCVAAEQRATAGCDWVTTGATPVPAACKGIFKGKLAAGSKCRSSLECEGALACQGLDSIDEGKCGPAIGTNAKCRAGADSLATFTRQTPVEATHPECDGRCLKRRCVPASGLGGDCGPDQPCGRGTCVAGKCAAAPPALGEACVDACAQGSGCVKGKCVAPKPGGSACSADTECRGSCVRRDGGTAGTCAVNCATER